VLLTGLPPSAAPGNPFPPAQHRAQNANID
jgi:hypothetical protein